MMYVKVIEQLLKVIKDEGTAKSFAVECQEDNDIIYPMTEEGIKEGLEYAEAVDDVIGIRSFGKDKYDVIGWFGIEPENEELTDIIFDWTDNEYCETIMNKLN